MITRDYNRGDRRTKSFIALCRITTREDFILWIHIKFRQFDLAKFAVRRHTFPTMKITICSKNLEWSDALRCIRCIKTVNITIFSLLVRLPIKISYHGTLKITTTTTTVLNNNNMHMISAGVHATDGPVLLVWLLSIQLLWRVYSDDRTANHYSSIHLCIR